MKARINDHPAVRRVRETLEKEAATAGDPLDATWLRQLALDCGADDAGLVEIGRSELDDQRSELWRLYPWTKTLLAFVVRMAAEPLRSSARSVANLEMHHRGEEVNEISGRIVHRLQSRGVRAVNPAMGFPMEMLRYPERIWTVAHKPVAIAAGLGHMGIHRCVIHPQYGSHILLGTVLLDHEATDYDHPTDYNPCLECQLCVTICPTGAISSDGQFNFAACYTHNYREFMGGFNDWVEQIVDSKGVLDYRRRLSEAETASIWQSLSFGPGYKAAYCIAVCPAGEQILPAYLRNPSEFLEDVVQPLKEKEETVYVVAGSDAEEHVKKHFGNKDVKPVGNAVRPRSVRVFLESLPLVFQPKKAAGLRATYHFTFTGDEPYLATISIQGGTLHVGGGHVGSADLRVTADGRTWLGFLAGERNLVWALLRRKVRLKGPPSLLLAFGRCFPTPSYRHKIIPAVPEHAVTSPQTLPFLPNDPVTGRIVATREVAAPAWEGMLRVDGIIDETSLVKTFRLTNPAGDVIPFDYLPGQYLSLEITLDSKSIRRSYTIASSPSLRQRVELTVKREEHGMVSRHLHENLKVGDLLRASGPLGSFTFTGKEHDSLALIAAGVGITPMMSVVRYLTDTDWPGDIHLLLGFRNVDTFIFHRELETLTDRHGNLHVTVSFSDADGVNEISLGAAFGSAYRGRIDGNRIAQSIPDVSSHRVHVCGPEAMMRDVRTALAALNLPDEQIHYEAFGTERRRPGAELFHASHLPASTISFAASGKTGRLPHAATLLEAADIAGVEIDNACRSGTCGSCKVRLLEGTVSMGCEYGLSAAEKTQGIVLACQAKATDDVRIDA